jgi:hypothetical protein
MIKSMKTIHTDMLMSDSLSVCPSVCFSQEKLEIVLITGTNVMQ